MPRKKRADVREILREKLEEPEIAQKFAAMILSIVDMPTEKVKLADAIKMLDYFVDNAKADAKAESVPIPEPDEDLSAYTDAQLWDWLKRLEGGKARGP